MILNHIIKKFCSGRADSSDFSMNKAVKFTFESSSPVKENKAELRNYVLSKFTLDALKVFAKSSAEEADKAAMECTRLDKELDEIHSEIASIRTPLNASEAVKDELKEKRNAKRRVRDGIRSSLEAALDKAGALASKADEYCALVELVTGETVLYRKLAENSTIRTFSDEELISFADKLSSEGGLDSKRYPDLEENERIFNVKLDNKHINGVSNLAGSYAAAVPAV